MMTLLDQQKWRVTAVLVAVCALTIVAHAEGAAMKKPNFFFVMVDDLGWGDVSFHRPSGYREVQTPVMDSLVQQGVNFTRHYVHYVCTPSRSSVQSGRLPVHVQTKLLNPDDPFAGIPRNMTGFAAKMKLAGYKTHQVGKWDAGMATPFHTPQGRGYDTSLNYFAHKNDYWTEEELQSGCNQSLHIKDFWDTDKPARKLNGTGYEEFLFRDRVVSIINEHPVDEPLFLFYTPHVSHCPLQVPKDYLDRFDFMGDDESMCHDQTTRIYPGQPADAVFHCRQTYHSMVNLLDDVLGNVTSLLKARGLWDNTLMILTSDNGGPLTLDESGANNHPLRGGKYSSWEGGIRAAAFAAGGYLPSSVRGTQQEGMMHVADWYTTFCDMVGVDPTDTWAAESGLPPVDGVNLWPLLSGKNSTSPRTEIPVDENTLIQGVYKLVLGMTKFSGWAGEKYPNASSPAHPVQAVKHDCGQSGCLFDIVQDPTEHNDIASSMPEKATSMRNRLMELRKGFYNNNMAGKSSCPPGIHMECACWMAENYYGGFFGPFQDLPHAPLSA